MAADALHADLPHIVVLGATGMLGQALCRTAARRGLRCTGLARRGADVELDATDAARLNTVLAALSPSIIINAAALTQLDGCERDPGQAYCINAGIVATLASYCALSGARLVQISTDHFFTGDGDRLHDEQSRVTLVNSYARSKFAGEAFALTVPDSLVVRTNLVGFRGWPDAPTFVEWALATLAEEQPMTLFDDFYTSSLDVRSFAEALFDVLDGGASGLLNIAACQAVNKSTFIHSLAEAFGLPCRNARTGSVHAMAGARRAESLGLDVRRAEALLGRALPDTEAVIAALLLDHKDSMHALR